MLELFVETAVHLEPSTSDAIVNLSVPSSSRDVLPLLSSDSSSQSEALQIQAQSKEEAAFVKQHLSSYGSIYFRQSRTYPRTFLWRLVDNNKVLELRCADLAKGEHEIGEAYLTLRFRVQDQVVPGGVALSDDQGQDGLSIFLITSSKQLHTLTVPWSFFKSTGASKLDGRTWCKTFVPSSFAIDTPHQIYAHNPLHLFISFDSGRIQSLTRKSEDHGSSWTQLGLDDKSWGASIRGMVKWHNNQSLQYNSRSFSHTTANAMTASPDGTYLYTICLNHTMRIWNLATGNLEITKDLLNRTVRPQDPPTIFSPAVPSFLHLGKVDYLDHSILVTFSPHDDGRFKFWKVRHGLAQSLTVEDMFPRLNLKPPDPDPSGNTIWSLAGFEMRCGTMQEPTEIWLLWRNNNLYQLYTLDFDLEDPSEAWTTNWVKTHMSNGPHNIPPDFVENDLCDPTEKWVEFLFWPNRYPALVLETSLRIYQDAIRIQVATSDTKKHLQERVCASIASNVNLWKFKEQELDYTRFALDTDTQWRSYWRTVEALNEKRKSPVSLAFDRYADLAWVLQSDQCCAIRECNSLERVSFNSQESLRHLKAVTAKRWPHRNPVTEESHTLAKMNELLDLAGRFTQSFTPELSRDCEIALGVEISDEVEGTVPARINDFYQRCDFGEAIPNETCDKVLAGIESLGGLQAIGSKLIPTVLSLLPEKVRGSQTALQSTIFGSMVVDAGLRDLIYFGRQTVYGLFVLVVFLECEVEQDATRSDTFDAASLFTNMLAILQEYEKKIWLLSHVRDVPMEWENSSKGLSHDEFRSSKHLVNAQATLLRDTTGKDIRPQPAVGLAQSYLLTEMLNDIEAWVGGASAISAEDGCVWIQCNLLAHGEVALASNFARFQPNTPWSAYVKGRLHLARGEYEQAALSFQKSAYPLGKSFPHGSDGLFHAYLTCENTAHGKAIGMLTDMSAGLLSIDETDYFNNGISCYYQHILALFNSAKAYSFAADCASLALAAMQHDQVEREASQDDVLHSLFTAELQCSRYTSAYATLTRIVDDRVQKRLILVWLDAVLAVHASSAILNVAEVIGLLQRLGLGSHSSIAQVADDHLFMLAQRQKFIPGPSIWTWEQGKGTDFLQILYALRVGRQDYRGAVSVMMDRWRLVKKSGQARNDPCATVLRHTLLALINIMSCVAPDQAYILSSITEKAPDTMKDVLDPDGRDLETGWKPRRRMIITLDDLRHEYQQLLDRCSRIERGDFDFDLAIDGEEGDDGSGFGADAETGGVDSMEF